MSQAARQFARNVMTVWSWFWLIFRWLIVAVFCVLFVIGLIYKFPWKVLTFLAVIPLVGILVPRKLQPWAWMTVVLLIAAGWVWILLPGSGSGQWKVYRFEPEFNHLRDDRIAPDRNAAPRYASVLKMHGETIFNFPFMDEQTRDRDFNQPWRYEDFPLLAEWLMQFRPAVAQLLEITRIPDCRFPIPVDLADRDEQLKRLNQMKRWALLLIWSANRDLAEDRFDRAFEKQQAVLNMARHLYQQQTLMDQAAAFHIELMAFRALGVFSVEYCRDVEKLHAVEQAFEQVDTGWAKSWKTIVDREKLIVKNIMALFYEVDSDGQTRIAHSAMHALQEGLGYTPRKLFLRQHEMNRLAVIGLWLSLPTTPQGIAQVIDERFDHYSLLAQRGEPLPAVPIQYTWRMGLNVRSLIDWFAIHRVRYFWALHGQNSRHQSMVELMRVFVSLKQYHLENHMWPKTLQDLAPEAEQPTLIDPVYGKPFVYRTTEDGFCLYSMGPNGTDDGGINNPFEDHDDVLFWPRLVTEEEFDNRVLVRQAVDLPESE